MYIVNSEDLAFLKDKAKQAVWGEIMEILNPKLSHKHLIAGLADKKVQGLRTKQQQLIDRQCMVKGGGGRG